MKHIDIQKLRGSGTCEDIYRHVCENLDSDINSEACREMRRHIESCDNCHALLDSMSKTVYLYKNYPTPKLSKQLEKDLFAVIRLEQSKKSKKKK